MSQTPPPYDPTELIATPPEPTDPPGSTDQSGHASRMRRFASPLLAGAVALLLAGGAGGYLLARQSDSATGVVDPAAGY